MLSKKQMAVLTIVFLFMGMLAAAHQEDLAPRNPEKAGRPKERCMPTDACNIEALRKRAIPQRKLPKTSATSGPRSRIHIPSPATAHYNVTHHPLHLPYPFTIPRTYPVDCYQPLAERVIPPVADDCRIIISHIILAYPSPMSTITFGYDDTVDFDLRDPDNEKWIHESCVILLRSTNKRITDRFRMVDVAIAAERVVSLCIESKEKEYSVEGITDVGSRADAFFVGVGRSNRGVGRGHRVGIGRGR